MYKYDLIGVTEAAAILGLTKTGIIARVNEGRMTPAAQIGKRGVLVFDRAEVEALAAEKQGAK